MLGMDALGAAIGDAELRAEFGRVADRFVAAEIKAARVVGALSTRLGETGQADALKDLVRRHLAFYGDLVERSLAFHQTLLEELEASAPAKPTSTPPESADALSLSLRTPQHNTLRSTIRVANHRAELISIACKASPFVSEDGSRLVSGATAFDPPAAELQPGVEASFDLIISVGENFMPGHTYLATVSVEGMAAMRVVVRLTVDPAGTPVAPTAAESPPRAKRGARRSAAPVATAKPAGKAAKRLRPKRPPKAS